MFNKHLVKATKYFNCGIKENFDNISNSDMYSNNICHAHKLKDQFTLIEQSAYDVLIVEQMLLLW